MKRYSSPRTINVLIVHGVEGYPTENFFDWLKLEFCGHRGLTFRAVAVPQFPTRSSDTDGSAFDDQTLVNWLETARKATKGWNRSNTILIGHSLGGLTVLRLAELASDNPYFAVFAVSPVNGALGIPEFDPYIETFYRHIKWNAVRAGARHITVIASKNDKIVPFKASARAARQARADRMITFQKSGHFNAAAGYKKFPFLLGLAEQTVINGQRNRPVRNPKAVDNIRWPTPSKPVARRLPCYSCVPIA